MAHPLSYSRSAPSESEGPQELAHLGMTRVDMAAEQCGLLLTSGRFHFRVLWKWLWGPSGWLPAVNHLLIASDAVCVWCVFTFLVTLSAFCIVSTSGSKCTGKSYPSPYS